MSEYTPASRLRIRVGMDVYTAYQDRYIGSVVHIWHGPDPQGSGAGAAEKEGAVQSVPLQQEEGHTQQHAPSQGKKTLGEEMGPVPTIAAGNPGPVTQSADGDYATTENDSRSDVICFAVRPGRINLGILTPPIYIPTTAVRSVSMERVVLDVDAVPEGWRHRPPFTLGSATGSGARREPS